jgi:hypothetical protein
MMLWRGELRFNKVIWIRVSYASSFVCVPWSAALDSSSMCTAVENRFQKYGSRTRAMMLLIRGGSVGCCVVVN